MVDSSVDAVGLFSAAGSHSYGPKGLGTGLYPSHQLVYLLSSGFDYRILMVIIILVCIGFGTSFHLTNAYGLTGLCPLNSQTDYSRNSLNCH